MNTKLTSKIIQHFKNKKQIHHLLRQGHFCSKLGLIIDITGQIIAEITKKENLTSLPQKNGYLGGFIREDAHPPQPGKAIDSLNN